MTATAVVLAGLPGRAHNATVAKLKATFPVGYVIRGVAVSRSDSRRTAYNASVLADVLSAAGDAVFGHSRRAVSFCRNPQRICAKGHVAGKTCGQKEGQTCLLEAPTRLLLLFQQGIDEERLLSRFHFSALWRRIPEAFYNKAEQTADYCAEQIRILDRKAGLLQAPLRDRGSPLLLPPKNFGKNGAVAELLGRINNCASVKESVEVFRRGHFRRDVLKYEGSRGLGFKPAEQQQQHGRNSEAPSVEIALAKRYRLGCTYDNSQHWDVSPTDGSKLSKNTALFCREYDRQFASKGYVNVWPDDWVGEI